VVDALAEARSLADWQRAVTILVFPAHNGLPSRRSCSKRRADRRRIAVPFIDTSRLAGDTAVVPPNTRHSVKALTAVRPIVVDHPRRDSVGGVDL
jgi:hypothetical protein